MYIVNVNGKNLKKLYKALRYGFKNATAVLLVVLFSSVISSVGSQGFNIL